MTTIKKIGRWISSFVEIWLPIIFFILLFIFFIANIVARYILKTPLNWTFEASANCFVLVALLSCCTAYRQEDHVVFDLFYDRAKPKKQNIFRIITHLIVFVFFLLALPQTVIYLIKLKAITSILKIPLNIIFFSYLIFLVSTTLRSGYRLYLDIRSLANKTYEQKYNMEEKETLI